MHLWPIQLWPVHSRAYMVMACKVMSYVVMACVAMAWIVMACVVKAWIVMACLSCESICGHHDTASPLHVQRKDDHSMLMACAVGVR